MPVLYHPTACFISPGPGPILEGLPAIDLKEIEHMRVNHINLQVSDVAAARDFFEKHFGMECRFQRRDELAIMDDGGGMEFSVSNLFHSPPSPYPSDFHIGFILEDEPAVRSTYQRLKSAGVEMKTDISRGGPSIYFMCFGPERIMIEVRGPAAA